MTKLAAVYIPDSHPGTAASIEKEALIELPSDSWSDWLLLRRHGGDPNQALVVKDAVQKIQDFVIAGAKLEPGMTLVDVGTGDGSTAFGALAKVGPSLTVILVDISVPLLAHAEEVSKLLGVRDRCSFIESSAERLDGVLDESADVLTTRAVIAYVPDKAAAVRQFFRVLKPGGRVSIAEPINQDDAIQLAILTKFLKDHPPDEATAFMRILQRCRALQLPSTIEDISRNPLTNYSERDLLRYFEDAGFTNIHLELHINIRKQMAIPWSTFVDTAPRPGAMTLREIFSEHLTHPEEKQVEDQVRPYVESGEYVARDVNAYLTAEKPLK